MTEEWSKLHWITLIPLVLRVTKTMLPVFLVSVFSAASSPNPSDYRTEVILTGLSALWVAALFMTTRFRSDGETISLRSGVIKKSTLTVKTSNVDTISVSQTPWSRLFGAAVVSVSDSADRTAIDLKYVSEVDATNLREIVGKEAPEVGRSTRRRSISMFAADNFDRIKFAFVDILEISGNFAVVIAWTVLLFAWIISQSGASVNVNLLASALSTAGALGWVISKHLGTATFGSMDWQTKWGSKSVEISSGFGVKKDKTVAFNKTQVLKSRTPLFLRKSGITQTTGSTSDGDKSSGFVLNVDTSPETYFTYLQRMFGYTQHPEMRPLDKRYLPSQTFRLATKAAVRTVVLSPWIVLTPSAAIPAVVAVCVVPMIVGFVGASKAARASVWGYDGNHVVMSLNGFDKTTDIIPVVRIQTIAVSQTLFQRRYDVCSVEVSGSGKKRSTVNIPCVNIDEATAMSDHLTKLVASQNHVQQDSDVDRFGFPDDRSQILDDTVR